MIAMDVLIEPDMMKKASSSAEYFELNETAKLHIFFCGTSGCEIYHR